jgi:predicted outer membrane repeat protein
LLTGKSIDLGVAETEISGEGPTGGGDFTAQSVIAGVNGWVVYIRSNGTTYQIYRHDQTNDARLQVFSDTDVIDSVAISLDGDHVFASIFNSTTNSYDIYELVISTAVTNQLTSTSANETNVSVNAAANVVIWEGDNAGDRAPTICVYAANSCSNTVLSNANNHVQPSISSNGVYIAMIEEQTSGNDRVRLYNRNSSTYLNVVASSLPLEHPSVSDDGIQVMYVHHDTTTGTDRIKIKNLATGVSTTERNISSPQFIEHPHITADGLYLAYGIESSAGQLQVKTRDITSNAEGSSNNASWDYFGAFWQKPIANFTRIYVDKDATAGLSNGRSWTNAFLKLQDALNCIRVGACPALGDVEVWVAAGVYYPDEGIFQTDNSEAATFNLINTVYLAGGFVGTETDFSQRNITTNPTILSGDILQDDTNTDGNNIIEDTTQIIGDNSDHVLTATSINGTAILDGFTVTAGQAEIGTTSPFIGGGGIYNSSSSPTITSVVFIGNSSEFSGGAIYNINSNPSISNSAFTGNTTSDNGGAIYNSNSHPSISNSTFSGNSADVGGAMDNSDSSNPTISNSTFSDNSADSYGGAIFNFSSSPTITNSTFSGNSAETYGGAMFNSISSPIITSSTFSGNTTEFSGGAMFNSSSSPTITNSTFSGNSADSYGGAMYNVNSSSSLTVTNSTFSGNSATDGGAIKNQTDSSSNTIDLQLINVSFSHNSATDEGGTIYNEKINGSLTVTLKNSILWNNTALSGDNIYNSGGSVSIGHSDVQGGWNGAEVVHVSGGTGSSLGGNINVVPRFIDANGPDNIAGTLDDNLRLRNISPCLDVGNNAYNTLPTDLDGNPRIVDGPDTNATATIDMGAYERQ